MFKCYFSLRIQSISFGSKKALQKFHGLLFNLIKVLYYTTALYNYTKTQTPIHDYPYA